MNAVAGARAGMLMLAIADVSQLQASFIPWLKNGGVFVPSRRNHKMGEDVFVVLTLPDGQERYPIAGRVAWITPVGAEGGAAAGIGVQFSDAPEMTALKSKIESLLAGRLESETPTYTM